MRNKDSEKAKYLLACLGEECGETQQMVGKSLRFGLDNSHQKYGALTNIIKEVHDIVAVYFLLLEELDHLPEINTVLIKVKQARVERNLC